jgi:hypothetical protein
MQRLQLLLVRLGNEFDDQVLALEVLDQHAWNVEDAFRVLNFRPELGMAAEVFMPTQSQASPERTPAHAQANPERKSQNQISKSIFGVTVENAKNRKRQREFLREKESADASMQNRCKLCPRCGRVFEHLMGCSDMICGRDTHGGNVQDGCGHRFSLAQANTVPKGYFDGADCEKRTRNDRQHFDDLHGDLTQWDLPEGAEEKLEAALRITLEASDFSVDEQNMIITNPAAAAKFRSPAGWNLLHHASASPVQNAIDMLVCESLISVGININEKTQSGSTALFLACRNGNLGACRALLAASADVNTYSKGLTALHAAIDGDMKDCETESMCRVLLACGADLHAEARQGNCGVTAKNPLEMATRRNKTRTMRLLSTYRSKI